MIRPLAALISAEVAARALQAFGFIVLARRVSVDELGRFALATSVLAYVSLILFPALDLVAVRAVARGLTKIASTAKWIAGLRLRLAVVALGVASLYSAWSDEWLVLLLALGTLAGAVNTRWVLQAREASAALGGSTVVAQAMFLAGTLAAPGGSLIWVAAFQVLGEAAAAAWCWMAARRQGVAPAGAAAGVAREERRTLMREAWPLQASLFLGVMMYNFDVLMLAWLGKRAEIAFYLAAYRFVTVFSPVFAAVQTAIYPRLSRAFPDFDAVRASMAWLTAAMAAACGALALALSLFGWWPLSVLYGAAYADAEAVLGVIAWVLPVQAARVVARQVALAWGAEAGDPWRVFCAVLVNAGADVALIPRWGAVGAAWSTLAAESVLLVLMTRAARGRV